MRMRAKVALEQSMLICSLLFGASYMHGKGKMQLCHHAKRGTCIRGPFWLKSIADPSLKCRAGCFRLSWLAVASGRKSGVAPAGVQTIPTG